MSYLSLYVVFYLKLGVGDCQDPGLEFFAIVGYHQTYMQVVPKVSFVHETNVFIIYTWFVVNTHLHLVS